MSGQGKENKTVSGDAELSSVEKPVPARSLLQLLFYQSSHGFAAASRIEGFHYVLVKVFQHLFGDIADV